MLWCTVQLASNNLAPRSDHGDGTCDGSPGHANACAPRGGPWTVARCAY